jgi:hypothetical protein
LDSSCGEVTSFELTDHELEEAKAQLLVCAEELVSGQIFDTFHEIQSEDVMAIKDYITKIISITKSLNLSKENSELTKPGLFIYEIFQKAGINPDNAAKIIAHVDTITQILSTSI